MNKKLHMMSFSLGGVFFILDQTLKQYFFHHPKTSWYLREPTIGLEYFENPGIAFGIPLPLWAIILCTGIIFMTLGLFVIKKQQTPRAFVGLSLLICGSLSNFLDRVFFHYTIDYIRIFTSLINIADVMIVTGVLLLLREERKNKKTTE